MGDGTTKPIEDVREGDLVLANDPGSSDGPVVKPVLHTLNGKTMRLIEIAFDRNDDGVEDGSFAATGMHPLWTKNAGWVNVEDITAGDELQSHEGSTLKVLRTTTKQGYSETHNLTVEGVHTFFIVVNGTSVLVHNDPPRIHGFAPDWVTKGAHVTSEGIELGIRGAGNGVKIVPIFSGENPADLNRAIRNVETWLENDQWRGKLLDRTSAATKALGQGSAAERAASGGTRALETSLSRWCK